MAQQDQRFFPPVHLAHFGLADRIITVRTPEPSPFANQSQYTLFTSLRSEDTNQTH